VHILNLWNQWTIWIAMYWKELLATMEKYAFYASDHWDDLMTVIKWIFRLRHFDIHSRIVWFSILLGHQMIIVGVVFTAKQSFTSRPDKFDGLSLLPVEGVDSLGPPALWLNVQVFLCMLKICCSLIKFWQSSKEFLLENIHFLFEILSFFQWLITFLAELIMIHGLSLDDLTSSSLWTVYSLSGHSRLLLKWALGVWWMIIDICYWYFRLLSMILSYI
jgi:hypothetical protein